MRTLCNIFIILITISIAHVDWGNVIESDINLSLETKYEIDVDKDGTKESDKSEDESNLTSTFLYYEDIKSPLLLREESICNLVISNYYQDNYSFYLVSRIERPPSFKLI